MNNIYTSHSFRLFKKRPSFIDGMASILDHSDIQEKYNLDRAEKEADSNALQADWLAIGVDLKEAIKSYVARASN